MHLKHTILTLLLCLTATVAHGRTPESGSIAAGVAGFDTNVVWQIHDNGFFRTLVTNYGYFGTVRNRLRDSLGNPVPVMESPPGSRVQYLYEAGLWIGGVVDGDTLVSSGMLGFGQAHELYADDFSPGVFSDRLGDEEWTFTYGDTLTDPETVREDPYDGPHRPLPVRIRQTSAVVNATLGVNGLFIQLVITNVGNRPIADTWVGWLVDPDIGHDDREDYWLDDITGHSTRSFFRGDEEVPISFAWAMDNDGDPDSNMQFNSRSSRRAIASMYLGGSPALTSESYNWWIPSLIRAWDWGPQQVPGDTNLFGGRGLEVRDRFRYRIMSNREKDYAQPYAAVNQTADGWIPPAVDSIARNYADGYDTRFLHSVGATTLMPGDSLVVNWVLAITPIAHSNPSHFSATFNADNPQLYLSGIGLSGIGQKMADLRFLWDDHFSLLPIRPPDNFRIESWNDTSGVVKWSPKQTLRLNSYALNRFTRSGTPDTRSVLLDPADSVFIDAGLDRSRTYYYTIASVADGSVVGTTSTEDSLLPDRPLTPKPPIARGLRNRISVKWEPPSGGDIQGYRLYRRVPAGEWELLSEIESGLEFVDQQIETAVIYEYRVTAISLFANESYPSPAARGVAFAFDGPPQIIDYTERGPYALTDKDSAAAAWAGLIPDAIYRDAATVAPKYTPYDFSPHPVTIVTSEGRSPMPRLNDELLDIYSNAQGITIISGRDLFNYDLALDSLVTVERGSIADAAGIVRAFYPRALSANPTRMNAEFVAADPVEPALPRLAVDPSRTGWGLNPQLPSPGNAIPFVGYFEIDTSRAEVIYAFSSSRGASSPLHGKPVAIVSKQPGRTLAVFAFPLSYVVEADARVCLETLPARMGYSSTMTAGDSDNDGSVTAADLVMLINYLYRDGYLINERNADVNGDCRVDLLDAVFTIDHLRHFTGLRDWPCQDETQFDWR